VKCEKKQHPNDNCLSFKNKTISIYNGPSLAPQDGQHPVDIFSFGSPISDHTKLKSYIPWCGTIRVVDGEKLVVDSVENSKVTASWIILIFF
jgi:hypothetical protein